MNNSLTHLVFYSFLFFTGLLNASLSNFCVISAPFPITAGLIYQIGKGGHNNQVRDYLEKSCNGFVNSVDFVGYVNTQYIDNDKKLIGMDIKSFYVGLPTKVFFVASCANILSTACFNRFKAGQFSYLSSIMAGMALTMIWAYIAPSWLNPFFWRLGKRYKNQVVCLS